MNEINNKKNGDSTSISSKESLTNSLELTDSNSFPIVENHQFEQQQLSSNTTTSSKNNNIKKFNRYFQTKLTINERVINIFSCALQRNDNHLLIHGTLYITCKYYAFYSNLFGYQTKFQGKWYDVRDIKKDNIALLFPTAIKFELDNHEKIVFASFITRNQAYDCIVNVWKTAVKLKKAKTEINIKPIVVTDENNNETTLVTSKSQQQLLRKRNINNNKSSTAIIGSPSLSSSTSSICSNKSKNDVNYNTNRNDNNKEILAIDHKSDTSSLTNSLSSLSNDDEITTLNSTTIDSNLQVSEINNNNNYKKTILNRLRFFLSFIITIIVHNSLNLKSKVIILSTSITSLSSISTTSTTTTTTTTRSTSTFNEQSQQQQQQQQLQTGTKPNHSTTMATSSFNNFAIIIIFFIILSILYLYVFIILTQINHIEEKLINLYKKLNF